MKLPLLILAAALGFMLTLLARMNNPNRASAAYLAPRQDTERHMQTKNRRRPKQRKAATDSSKTPDFPRKQGFKPARRALQGAYSDFQAKE